MLTRPARQLAGRILAGGALLAVGTGYWSSRPLLIALVLFAVLVVMVETDQGPPWALVPLMWVWLNVHGSWPLGLAYLVLRMIGPARRRRRAGPAAPAVRRSAPSAPRWAWLNPIGPAAGRLSR